MDLFNFQQEIIRIAVIGLKYLKIFPGSKQMGYALLEQAFVTHNQNTPQAVNGSPFDLQHLRGLALRFRLWLILFIRHNG